MSLSLNLAAIFKEKMEIRHKSVNFRLVYGSRVRQFFKADCQTWYILMYVRKVKTGKIKLMILNFMYSENINF